MVLASLVWDRKCRLLLVAEVTVPLYHSSGNSLSSNSSAIHERALHGQPIQPAAPVALVCQLDLKIYLLWDVTNESGIKKRFLSPRLIIPSLRCHPPDAVDSYIPGY